MKESTLFSIVTPSYNSEKYIAETIESVISQSGDFSIEYIIVDNCSTDNTGEIVRSYQNELQAGVRPLNCKSVKIIFISESDEGMYDAIRKGFSVATGKISAWINSDDIYLNGSFNLIDKVLRKFPDVRWVKGITSYITSSSTIYSVGKCNLYSRELIKEGVYGPVLNFIQQDSVFWIGELWEEAGGIDPSFKLAGDYDLWRRFANFSPLYSVNAYVSCFRKVHKQKSEQLVNYWKEIENIEDIKSSNKKLCNRIKKFEKKRIHNPLSRLFRPVSQHIYHLIQLKSNGALELHDGEYEDLQNYL